MPKTPVKLTTKKVTAKIPAQAPQKTTPKAAIKPQVKVSSKIKEEKKLVEKDSNAKVLKSDELLGGGGGFLSGLGFKKEDKTIKQKEEEKRIEEEQQESIVLEKPRRSPMSFDKVESTTPSIVGRRDDSFVGKTNIRASVRPGTPIARPSIRPTSAPTIRPRNTAPQHGGKQFPVRTGYQGSKPQYGNNQAHRPFNKPAFQQSKPVVPQAPKVQKIATTSANLVKKIEIYINDKITVKEFSEKMGVPLPELMKKLIQNKIMTSITASLDFDTAALIASEFSIVVKKNDNKVDVQTFMSGDLQAILDMDKGAECLLPRPPIVTVMGHVDHGKTSLLDYLRKTVIAEGEAGGITQSIGASVVEYDGKKICFIDTPGHELFTSLRARGAKLTNIAIIVVAADDSVMPQTIESIGHAKESGVPIIIAITKIDKPGKNIEHIKQDLAKYGLTPEDWGGDTPMIGISSKTGQGIPELLETVLLQTEMLDLKYNPNRSAVGVIVDAHKDPKQGVVSTIIVMTGTLKIGDTIVAYNTTGKIRRMQNWKGQSITSATGGEPIQLLGITDLPEPGRIVEVVKNEKEAQEKISLIQEQVDKNAGDSIVKQFISQVQAGAFGAELKLILKSDGSSSLEALKQAVNAIVLPKNVTMRVIQANVGHFSDSDLSLAQASGALLLGFNISMNAMLKKKADSMKIEMKNFDIIYELVDYLNKLLLGMVEIEQHEVMFAKLEVLGIFFTKNKDMTIGGKVIFGKLHGKPKFSVMRGEDIICTGHVVSLHKNKDTVKEVGEGDECGLKVITGKKIEISDIIEFYEMQDKPD
ncbi:MAG: translation initiation factor IF-2 [candidate division SR1 bacterium]|nr:translation initiation factor IF-2 [candidate division SR1 bacterium]